MQCNQNVTVRFCELLCTFYSIKSFVFPQRECERQRVNEREREKERERERMIEQCL